MKITDIINEFAADDGSGGEEDTLLKYARMWYNGDDETQQRVEQVLDRMGWEIGEVESEEGGVFVVQSGDINGNSYIGFAVDDLSEGIAEDWNKVNRRDKTDGLSRKAVKAYRRENPGSKLQTAVTTKPSKLKKGSKAAKRRKSFCARMSGNKGPMKKPNGKPTPKALALRRWNCESIEEMQQLIQHAEQVIKEEKQRLDPSCWKGYKKQGTKMKGGVRVNNCVPKEDIELEEKWTQKYKNSINCSNPKGFSQKAHCAGKKK